MPVGNRKWYTCFRLAPKWSVTSNDLEVRNDRRHVLFAVAELLLIVGQLQKNSNQRRIDTILHTVVKLRHDRACSTRALNAQPPTATTSCRVHIASLARGLFQSPHPPKAWNRPPTKLKTSTCSTDSFKRSLKTFLFQSAYGCETRVG